MPNNIIKDSKLENRLIVYLDATNAPDFCDAEIGADEYAVLAIEITSPGTVVTQVQNFPAVPLRNSSVSEIFICKAPNLTFRMASGRATIFIDRKASQQGNP